MEKLTFKVNEYEGPLDLILALLSKHQIGIYDINISDLLEQYMAYIRTLRENQMEVASEFLEMASRLVYIKTASLLPRYEKEEDPRAELVGQLLEYQSCKQAAALLRLRDTGWSVFTRAPMPLEIDPTYRRRHPISIAEGLSTRDAFLKERQILEPLRVRADYTINTALLSTAQNKERICDLFLKNGGAKSAMRLTIMSFGFKFGLPPEADLVLDVRCLPNPFYVPALKHKTGLDQEVVDFVMSHPEAKQLLERYELFLQVALPLYVREGKSQLTIAVGCTGGKHRSITFARKIAEYCTSLGYEPGVQHRDAMR